MPWDSFVRTGRSAFSGFGSRIVSAGGGARNRLRYTETTQLQAQREPSRRRLSAGVAAVQAVLLQGRRHPGGVVERSSARGNGRDERHPRSLDPPASWLG